VSSLRLLRGGLEWNVPETDTALILREIHDHDTLSLLPCCEVVKNAPDFHDYFHDYLLDLSDAHALASSSLPPLLFSGFSLQHSLRHAHP
jgi:hypothetical protein